MSWRQGRIAPLSVYLEKLEAVAKTQFGYFTAKQAKSCGMSKRLHCYHCQAGNWLKCGSGLFRLAGCPDSLESEFTRWSLWSRNNREQPQAVVSHESALQLYGLAVSSASTVHLTVPLGFRKKAPAGCQLHKTSLNLSLIDSRGSFLVTRLPQTLRDLRDRLAADGRWEQVLTSAGDLLSPAERLELSQAAAAATPPSPGATWPPDRPEPPAGGELAAPAHSEPQAPGPGSNSRSERVFEMIFAHTQGFARSRRAQAGFTLVELLVVVSIMSVLMAMLLPALRETLESCRKTVCTNNLKQIAMLGAGNYVEDYGWYYKFAGWRDAYSPYVNSNVVWHNYGSVEKIPGVYVCPTGKPKLDSDWKGYTKNNILYEQALKNPWSANHPVQYLPSSAVSGASRAITHYCCWRNTWNESWSGNPPLVPDTHASGRPLVYADFHVECHPELVLPTIMQWGQDVWFAGWDKTRLSPP